MIPTAEAREGGGVSAHASVTRSSNFRHAKESQEKCISKDSQFEEGPQKQGVG